MNSLLNDDREDLEDTYRTRASNDREITLGTMTILGMFFALAVLCAVFFGFGYTTGRHTTPTVQAASIPPLNSNSNSYSGGLKPSAGNPLGNPLPTPSQTSSAPELTPVPAPKPAPVTRLTSPDSDPDASIVGVPPAPRPAPVAAAAASTPVTASPSTPGSFMVQVAAVSHQEDGDLLVTTLKRAHYDVAIHHESQDKLLHVQIGPFANRKDADAMRQRLLGDGFNAIVK